MPTKNKYFILAFIAIITLAFAVRIYRLDSWVSPYWEEVALGYDAYSIAQTGKDHHGNFLPTVAFESFGDWKPSLYFYTIVPFIKLFGLSVAAVRLPAVLSGVGIVVGLGVLVKMLSEEMEKKKRFLNAKMMQLWAMFITALNPWAIQFSRAGWEVNLATALILWGVIFGFKFLREKSKRQFVYLIISSFFLILATYSYHAARITAPLLGLGLIVSKLCQKKPGSYLKQNWRSLLFIFIFSLTLLTPIIDSLKSSDISQRFRETSLFSEIGVIEESNHFKEVADNSLISRIIYHRYLLFGKKIVNNLFQYFNFDYLFISGDSNPRHSTQYFGLFYHFEFFLILAGIYSLISFGKKKNNYLFYWLLVGIIPAILTKTNPHALRTLLVLPVWLVFIVFGLNYLLNLAKRILSNTIRQLSKQQVQLILSSLTFFIYSFFFNWYFNYLINVYPQQTAQHWQNGYKGLVNKIVQLQNSYPDYRFQVSRAEGRPAMYYWFYQQTDPIEVQQQANQVRLDQGEFLEFNNLEFVDSVDAKPKSVTFSTFAQTGKTDLTNNCQAVNSIWFYCLN
ncbi:MAG: hypothetical protein U9O78_04395 [Patescibacteria group bacterium]|nr:hypothetical protein [Patescibacteria group bacterium]